MVALGLPSCSTRRPPVVDMSQPGTGTAELEILPAVEPQSSYQTDAQKRPPPETAPQTLSQSLPTYPPSALEHGVACSARLLYHIQTDGSATLVRLAWDSSPPQEHLEAFESAIRAAVATWEFKPAMQLRLKTLADGSARFDKRVIPKAGHAIIRFRVDEGKAVID